MDQVKWTTPNKNDMSYESPVLPQTPLPKDRLKYKQNHGFSFLPNHITPPSGLVKFIARNPFETELTSKLQSSVISPSVFKINSPAQDSPTFGWTIEDLAQLQPAKIEEFSVHQIMSPDPEVERQAQAAITKFFSQELIHPSPWDSRSKDSNRPVDFHTTRRLSDVSDKETKDCWAQTILSLPPTLPVHLEEALKPYFTFTQEQNVDNNEGDKNNSSLRRKLFFNHNESSEDPCVTPSLSPIRSDSSVILGTSPLQSGSFVNCTSLRRDSSITQRSGTPMGSYAELSPINISPISTYDEMSFQSGKSRGKSVARLDFTTEMCVDMSEGKEHGQGNADSKMMPKMQQAKKFTQCFHSTRTTKDHDDMDMGVIPEDSSYNGEFVFSKRLDFNEKRDDLADETCKIYSSTFQSTTCAHHSAYSSSQDTGYQTYSMNSMQANKTENSITAIKRPLQWDENTNIVCSTPSKSKHAKEAFL